MAEITIKDGKISSVSYVQCTREHVCPCGVHLTITMNLPEDVSYDAKITVNQNCPECGESVVIPRGHHYIEDYRLLTKSFDS